MNRSKWRGQRATSTKLAIKPSTVRKLKRERNEQVAAGLSPPPLPSAPQREVRAEKRTLKDQRRRVYDGGGDTMKLLEQTMKVVAKSQKSFKDVYLDGGPCPSTLNNWSKHAVRRPGLMTVLGALQACGNLRIAIIDEDGQIVG